MADVRGRISEEPVRICLHFILFWECWAVELQVKVREVPRVEGQLS